ncbi:MAG: substrate-binding domain-containing protein [Chloroflexi bacterium]|nr:substrate-binding domain-containing protein [Chloroflexota bacterium]
MFKKASLVLVILMLAVLTVAPVMGQGETLRIAFSVPGLSFPFFVHMEKQIQDEAAKLGGIELIVLDGQDKTEKQIADLEQMIAEQVDGVIISPRTSDGLAPAVQEVIDAGIPVVTIDRNVAGDTAMNTLAHVGADNVKGGEAQGELLLKMFPNGARIFNLQGTPGASPAIDRNQGLHNVIDPVADKYQIIFEQTANFNRADGLNVTENGLAAQDVPPDVIVAANDDMALGAVEALKARNLVGQVVVFGFDALPEALDAVRDGALTGSVEQFPGGQSRTALNLMVEYLLNGTAPAQHDNFLIPKMITRDNFDEAERLSEVPPIEAGSKGRIVFIPKSTDVSYWLWVKAGVEERAALLGYSTDYQGVPREIDIAQQGDLVRNVAAAKPAGIVMAATDAEALVAPVEEAIAAGVPVVMVDSGVNSDAPYATITTDNLGAAAEGARVLAQLIGETGKVGNLGILAGSQTGSERDQGFLDEIAKYPNIEVLPTQFTGCDPSKALNAATDLLTANPDIVGFYSACGPNGLGIAQAVKALGLEGKVKIVTFDPNPEVTPLFEDGTISAMIAQNPFAMGLQGVDAIDALVKGYAIRQKNVAIPVVIITPENYDTPEIQALVTPPES